ncbi:LOW QUALITY PROTEIN: diuretic hormone receptor-like [Portunus trituberculatus]|uniref:LOW QUALITY PROTEIN: diuretic hormone receptor-like n=1 Tax=Portunus trituberculatus TaxID=210409 RepID=UPI001E1CFE4C|nr:LOW QUALITY PROTEIN: diuretic hormone receptor-like [Portunus trituberculatus]
MPAISGPSEDPLSYPDPEPDPDVVGVGGLGVGEGGGEGEDMLMGERDDPGYESDGLDLNHIRTVMWNRFMEQSTVIVNATDDGQKVLSCFDQFIASILESKDGGPAAGSCPVKFDGVSCWPQTPPGTLRIIPCFDVFNGVYYDPSENNATLYCYANGTWSSRSFYDYCLNAITNPPGTHAGTSISTIQTTFYVGNSLSLAAVALALWIFISFKDLRCLRNTIHTNLLFTYLLHNLFWIIYASVKGLVAWSVGCGFFVTLNYFTLTNFMWMFVEGFYLYMLVVKTFSVENIKLRVYILIGWGIPVPIVALWVILKSQLAASHEGSELEVVAMAGQELEGLIRTCPPMPASHFDWLHKVPVLVVLSLNLLFLAHIMWVLITKLRSANTVETQRYRKATKALLVLIPLLGLTYMLLIALPQELEHVRAVLLSTQGFWVALFFCFVNSEVQNSIRHHIERWKTARGLADPRCHSVRHRDGSPRPKTGCSSYGRRLFGGKRESLCSEVTTMTTYVANGYQPVSTQTTHQHLHQHRLLQHAPLPQAQPPIPMGHLAFRNSTAGLSQSSASETDGKINVKDSLL